MMTTDAADFCLSDDDCDDGRGRAGRGRSCVRLYDGCLVGQCMCRSTHQSLLDSAGRCVDGESRSFVHLASLGSVAYQLALICDTIL